MTFEIPKSVQSTLLSYTGVLLCISAVFLFIVAITEKAPASLSTNTTPLQSITLGPDAVSAKAAIIYDPVSKRVLYSKNADMALPLASLTKLATAAAVLTLQKQNESVSITTADIKPEGDWGLVPGQVWQRDDLLRFGLVASANDAINAAANAAGTSTVNEMNSIAKKLGLTHTSFSNPTGLDLDSETAGAYGSVQDVAVLAAAFYATNPELFETTSHDSVTITSGKTILEASSTDTPLLDIPGLVGAKTGYTDLAGGNLVAIVDLEIGHPVVVAVLGSTRDGRFDDIHTLVTAARQTISKP